MPRANRIHILEWKVPYAVLAQIVQYWNNVLTAENGASRGLRVFALT
jgi:hypothetical protein